MQMDSRIILAGQPVNALGALNAGTTAAANANQVGRDNAMVDLFQQHGAGIMSGDSGALNALAGLDPMAALDVRSTHQQMAERQERLQMARATAARQAQAAAAQMTAADREAEAERISQGLAQASYFYSNDDREGYNAFLNSVGLDPEQYDFDSFPIHAATMEGVRDALVFYDERNAGPEPGFVQLSQEEVQQRGLDPSRAYQVGPDGRVYPIGGEGQTINFFNGEAGAAPPPAAPPPREPVSGAGDVFGLPGVGRNIANTAADAIGANVPFPEAQDAAADVQLLADQLTQDLAGGYDRQPPSWLMQSIRDNIPEANRMTTGPSRARSQYTAILRDFEDELETQERALAVALQGGDDRVVTAVQNRITSLETSIGRIRAVLNGINPEGGVTLSEEDQALVDRWSQ